MADLPITTMSTVEADSTSHSTDVIEETGIHKKPKTYENRKLSSTESTSQNDTSLTSSPCSDSSAATTSSPQNTSRYGRARKAKINEDFYNTEDIFGPYERIPCSPVRIPKKKATTKLELSPNKSNEIVTLDAEVIKPNLDAMLSIDIPEETIEVSKVMKIVSNNTSDEFSPKSPSFSKPLKTYSGKREKKNSELIFDIESFGLPDYPTGENCPYVNGLSHSEDSNSDSEVVNKNDMKLCDAVVNSNTDSEKIKRTKFNLLSLKKNTKSPVKNLIQSDNISTSTPTVAIKPEIKNVDNHYNKQKLKVSKLNKNKFRVQKKPIPISRLKAKKLKALKKVSASKINLGKQNGPSGNSDASPTEKKKFEAIADLHKMYMPEVGDLTWSRVGSFPFWPSIVTKEPDSDRHTRTINFGKRITHFYHVNFFGDNGRRSWVLHTHIFPFHQRSDLEIMAKSVSKDAKPKEPRHLSAYIINPTKLVKWETAVTEAESLSEFSKDKRIKKFFEMVSPRKKSATSGKISKKLNKKKMTRKYSDDKSVATCVEVKQEDDSYEDINESYGRARRKSKKRKSSIVSEDSFTDSERGGEALVKQEARDTPSPVLSSSARHKKINLFKGISRERVCQMCGKGKAVFKCKGQCYGQYHIECDRKQRLRLPAACDDKTDFETLIGENIVGKRTPELQVKQEEDCGSHIASSIVQEIVTNVFESVLPEKKSSNGSSLSIADQIDLKMQEVMKNVVQTNYNDSTTDYSSGSETDSKANSQSGDKITKKVIKHVTADGVFDVIAEEAEPEPEPEGDRSNFKCTYCSTGYKPPCFICNKEKAKSGDVKKHKCMTTQCGKYYHAECLKDWPQTKWYMSTKRKEIDNENLSCPYHYCHTCISDDPRGPLSRMNHEKLAKCIRCPTTYHTKSYCIPAGTEILSAYQIICPKHLISTYVEQDDAANKKSSKAKFMHHVNASWCFICSMGGSLICCETCPSSFHVECLKMTPPEGKYICEECESGRLPLYDEIVWVKLGSYRWWPAQVLFPAEIPENVKNIAHNKGEFVVRFFGSHDHYWVNRGRVFLFQEGDTGHASSKKSAADRLFVKAIEEATKAHQKFVGERADRVADSKNSMKPPSYIKIKVNKPVGDVRITDADTSNTTPCDCDPNWDQPCGPDSDCLNRILLTECNPMVCAAGSRCRNQAFQNREYAQVEPFKTSGRGWGLRTLSFVTKGTFVIEYVGEVINETEYMRRMKRKHEQKDENYYFLTIDKDRMIDAGPKGNVARFMNHSCSPNCETQKWTVNGDTKVGLFAIQDIPEGAELTFNYNLECIGEEKKECRCGAPNCSGFIGVKAKQDELLKKKKGKKSYKKKSPTQETKDFEVISCFVCGKTNAIQQCDREACNKFYHLECVNLESLQEAKWFCPWHSCNVCTKRTTRCCFTCINSYCPLHSEENIRYDRVKGFICKEHDTPELKAINAIHNQEYLIKKLKKSKSKIIGLNLNEPKKPKKVSEKSLANLKQYRDLRHKLANQKKILETKNAANTNKETTNSETPEIKTVTNESSIKKENTPVEPSKFIEKTNGLHPDVKVETISASEPPNQNNNLTIKKRKSRLNNGDDDSDEDDNLPLSKRFKLDDNEVQSITKNMTNHENVKIATNETENSKYDEELGIIVPLKKELTPQITKVEVEEDPKEKVNKNQKENVDKETKEQVDKNSKENVNRDSKETINKGSKENVNGDSKETVNKGSKENVNGDPKEKVDIDTKEKVDKDSKEKVNKDSKERIDKETKVVEDLKETVKATEVVVKRPRGRPRKYFPTPNDIKTNIVNKSNVPEIKEKMLETTVNDTTNSSMELSKSESQSQSSEYDSEMTTDDDDDSSRNNISIAVDLECDAEDGIKKSVIDKETLHVISINTENTNERRKIDTKRMKLISPRPGTRKSLRITDPFDTSSNVSNSELEISIDLNSSKELDIGLPKSNSTLLEEKRGPGRPKSSFKKKGLNLPVRKSSRFSNTEETIEITKETREHSIETKDHSKETKDHPIETKDLPKETPNKNEDTSNSISTTLDATSSPGPVEETQKRKRGRPRKYFNVPAVVSPKRPIGRPKKIKLIEEPPKPPNVEEATELYKMKLNTETTKPKTSFETHVNEIKLTTNVPERHLRVMLRKSEIDSRAESKFLQMQNDIERDLPIRKRSKLSNNNNQNNNPH